MPDIIFLTAPNVSDQMGGRVFEMMGNAVAQAVSDTLGLEGPHQVAVYEVTAKRSLNANPIQILCIASKSRKRQKKLVQLRDNIGVAIQSLSSDPECTQFFNLIGTIESWPILPEGSWAKFSLR